jgi:hypothetical protein
LFRASISAGAGNPALDAGPLHYPAMNDGPTDVLTPVVAAPAVLIDADTQRTVDAIDAATARFEWAGASISELGISQTVTARMRDVNTVRRLATVSQALRTDNGPHGYRVLADAPSTLF